MPHMVRPIHHKYGLIYAHAVSITSPADSALFPNQSFRTSRRLYFSLIPSRLLRDKNDSSRLVPVMEKLDAEVATLVACASASSGVTSPYELLRCGGVLWLTLPLMRARTPTTKQSRVLRRLRHVSRDCFPFSRRSHPVTDHRRRIARAGMLQYP